MTPTRRVALVVLGVGLIAFVTLAALRVPWQPVPGGMPEPVPADSVLTPAQLAAAEDYSHQARLWSRLGMVIGLAVACTLGFTPLGRRLMARLPGPWWLRVAQGVLVLTLIGTLVTLPTSALLHERRREVGLSHQGWSGFARDQALSAGVAIVATTLVLLVLLACIRRWRRAWPAVAGTGLAVLVLGGSFGYPVLVEPLFNDFRSLPAGPLRTDVFALAEHEQVAIEDVLVADASRRTTTLNAYVSGFGASRRVVLYDNLVDEVPRPEALSVVAHELAHAKHDDVLTGSLLGAAAALIGLGLLGLLLDPRHGRDPEVVPRLLALFAVASVLALPVENTISRQIETRADVVALQATDDPEAFVELQRKLAVSSLQDPTPAAWSQLWFGSHPTVLERIAIARQLAG